MEAEGAVIELVTRCSSVEEFIDRFARFATETDIVVPAPPHVTVGSQRHFVIGLKDGTVVMKGRCEVTELRPLAGAPGAAAAIGARAHAHAVARDGRAQLRDSPALDGAARLSIPGRSAGAGCGADHLDDD